MPGRGTAYGLARWLRQDDIAKRLSDLPRAQVSFNYLGRLDPLTPTDSGFALEDEPPRGGRHPANPRPYLLDVVAGVRAGRLHLYLGYSTRHHRRETMVDLAAAFGHAVGSLVDHCSAPGAGGPTPSDFPLAQVDSDQLDRLAAEHGRLADVYPLAPLQRGLLFETLANPGSGVYFEQFSIRLDGPLDLDAFERAWNALLRRHAVLRAGIAWQGLAVPHLVVREQVELPLTHHDWRGLAEAAQAARLEQLLERDRVQGFDLTKAPLTRLHLVHLAPQRWRLIWSHHHILLDGWSVAILIQEVFDSYEAIRVGQFTPAPPPPPYRDYIAYLASLDLSGAWAHWRRVLGGITEPTPLGADRPVMRTGRRDADYARVHRRLSVHRSNAIRDFVRTARLTLDTVLHGAWALLLAQRSGRDDVVFGVTSSGRPPALAGVEEMVGLFISTLPARVRVSRGEQVTSWLSGLLRDQVQTRQFEHTPLDQVRSWTSVPPDRPLFDSGRGLENYPMDGSRFRTGSVAITEIETFEQSNYALSFVVVPDDALFLQLWYDALRFAPQTADQMLATVEALALGLIADPHRTVGEVLAEVRQQMPARDTPLGAVDAPDRPLPRLVERWAVREPERTAVCGHGGPMTYAELDRRANQMAGWLGELGAGSGTRVGVALPRTADSVAVLLGVLKAGAVCVPIPAGDPPVWDQFPVPLRPSVLVPDDLTEVWGRSAEPPAVALEPTDVAMVVWWQDGPGALAATELTHAELTRRAHARREEVTGTDVMAQLASFGSEAAAWEISVALGNGAALALGLTRGGSDGTAGGEALREQHVTVLTSTGGELVELLEQQPAALDRVRLVVLRGDPASLARHLLAARPRLRLESGADVETGRVTHLLQRLPLVGEVAVVPTPDGRGLTACLLPDTSALEVSAPDVSTRLAAQHVQQWQALYDHTYAGSAAQDPTFHVVGWNSSYTDAPIAAEAMRRMACAHGRTHPPALGPARVLEIGCGTGLMLFGLARRLRQLHRHRLLPRCLAQLREHVATMDPAHAGKCDHCWSARPTNFTDLAAGQRRRGPSSTRSCSTSRTPPTLPACLDEALRVVAPTGAIFIGDVRHHGLRAAFHASVQLSRAADLLPADELSTRVRQSLARERELLVDPGFFTALAASRPEVGSVEVMPKRGRHDNELTRYRYDTVVRLGAAGSDPVDVTWYDWHRDVLSRGEVGWLLDNAGGDAVGVTGVPNARVAVDVEAARLVDRLHRADGAPTGTAGQIRLAAAKAPRGMDPEELYELGEGRGWSVAVSWATHHADGSLNVLFRRGSERASGVGELHVAGSPPERDLYSDPHPASASAEDARRTNAPLHGVVADELERHAWQALRQNLPEYVNASRVLVVDEIARTADGRVDEVALLARAGAEDAAAGRRHHHAAATHRRRAEARAGLGTGPAGAVGRHPYVLLRPGWGLAARDPRHRRGRPGAGPGGAPRRSATAADGRGDGRGPACRAAAMDAAGRDHRGRGSAVFLRTPGRGWRALLRRACPPAQPAAVRRAAGPRR